MVLSIKSTARPPVASAAVARPEVANYCDVTHVLSPAGASSTRPLSGACAVGPEMLPLPEVVSAARAVPEVESVSTRLISRPPAVLSSDCGEKSSLSGMLPTV